MMVISEVSKSTKVKYDDLEMAYSFVSDTVAIDAAAYVCRKTGKIFWESSELDDEFKVPDDIGSTELYAMVPNKHDLDLGTRLVFQFVRQYMPEQFDRVSNFFNRRGAYGRYKDFLSDQRKLNDWYVFENAATEMALREWAEEEGFTIVPLSSMDMPIRIYQFRIELMGIAPPIWRRIQVPENYSFWDLHVAIQDAMGWLDYHLHAFRMVDKTSHSKVEIGIPDDEFSATASATVPGWKTAMVDYFHEVGVTAEYEYDFGDGWLHTVVLEGIFLNDPDIQYPLCVGGERACPVEDCGGVHGYSRLLGALSGSDNGECEEQMNWLGMDFKPEKFNHHSVEFDDPQRRWERAFLDN
ncbi:MAG: plasmid pRiA4b ORF-3 family protein [Planctomycetota bacterium]|jgi:hypothetical protein